MDSFDFARCEICDVYEICLISQPCGKESGLYSCEEGHHFCLCCLKKGYNESGLEEKDVDEWVALMSVIEEDADEKEDEFLVPSGSCPICVKPDQKGEIETFEHCNCYGTIDILNPKCPGDCGRNCRLYRDEIIHFRGKHWHAACALKMVLVEMGELKT